LLGKQSILLARTIRGLVALRQQHQKVVDGCSGISPHGFAAGVYLDNLLFVDVAGDKGMTAGLPGGVSTQILLESPS
jgi:hypothetical protein